MSSKKSRKGAGGRKSKYETEWKDKLVLVQGWARDGLIDRQIAAKMGIHVGTLYEWKKRYPEFSDALKKGKEVVDREVENALLQTALGYDYIETTGIKVKTGFYDERGVWRTAEEVKVVEIQKHQPGDKTAQIFWLKNRKPAEWRDKREVEMSGSVGVKLEDWMQ